MKNKSFTLIELLVVIAVIGLLASIVIVNLTGTRSKANIARGLQFSQSIHHTLGAYAVGVWSFDEGSGTTANDSSGYGNNGNLTNGPVWRCANIDPNYTPSGQSCALEFDGVNDYLNIGDKSSLELMSTLSFGGWIYWNGVSGTDCPFGKEMAYKIDLNDAENGNRARFCLRTSGTTWCSGNILSDSAIPKNKWVHIFAVYDGLRAKLFINGIEQKIDAAFSGTIVDNSNPFTIGFRQSADYFSGLIDDVRIYEEALSVAQIQQLYVEGTTKKGLAIK